MTLPLREQLKEMPRELKLDLLQALQKRTELTPSRTKAARYFDTPSLFVQECFRFYPDEEPASYQLEALEELRKNLRYTFRGPRGLGKTTVMAWAIIWFAFTREGLDWKIPTTATINRQLKEFLWPEIHKWIGRIKWDVLGRPPVVRNRELMDMGLRLKGGSAFVVSAADADGAEGPHAKHLLYVMDEGKGIPEEIFDATEGTMTEDNAMWLLGSTPGPPVGRFYNIHAGAVGYEDWKVRHVTKGEAVAAGRISQKWLDKRAKQWGKTSPLYIRQCEGNFAGVEEGSLIDLAWIETAMAKKLPEDERVGHIGVDVGEYGADDSVAAPFTGTAILPLIVYHGNDLMQVCGMVSKALKTHGMARASIDSTGVGAGVTSRLIELEEPVIRLMVGAKARSSDYDNIRAEMFWILRELLRLGELILPKDEKLKQELLAINWKLASNGKISIEKKEKIKKRLGRSPDRADAVAMAVYEPIVSISFKDALR